MRKETVEREDSPKVLLVKLGQQDLTEGGQGAHGHQRVVGRLQTLRRVGLVALAVEVIMQATDLRGEMQRRQGQGRGNRIRIVL